MGLKTKQIVQILQLKGLGRKSAFKICEKAKVEVLDNDDDLIEFIDSCIARKWVSRLPDYSKNEYAESFKRGDEIFEQSVENNIKILSYFDEEFPQQLKVITDAPILLNFRGAYQKLNLKTGIAIIGTREPTIEGIQSGEYLGEQLGKEFNIVSGLAKGCDSAAHNGCLKGNGFTSAVVAHGLHTIYPKENTGLADKIVASGGVLISEYFIGTGPLPNYFVERDRLQAGLSKATIVIQTGISGGTMHAVNATLESKKPLAAVKYKGDFNSDKIKGNEMLIEQKKAFPLTSNNLNDFINLIKNQNIKNDISTT